MLSEPRVPAMLVSDPQGLAEAVHELSRDSGSIAIDAERASGFRYSQRAYLVQLRSASSPIFLLDPIAILEQKRDSFSDLSKLLADRQWILHAATQDLSCLAELELEPGAIFDTELAARIAGQPRVGLGPLAENLLGLRLTKEHSAADWSTRPLPNSWLTYAALDVDVLHDLKDAVHQDLESQGKISWVNEEFAALKNFKPKPQKEDRWRSVSGVHKISDRQLLAIAKSLWEAREALAQKLDVSPGRLIPDSSILAVVTSPPGSKPELATRRDFTGRASRSYLDLWWQAISEGLKEPDPPSAKPPKLDAIPNHRSWPSKFPEADLRLRLAKDALTKIAEKNRLPLENMLTPDTLRQLCFTPPVENSPLAICNSLAAMGARNWQIQLVADTITEAFSQAAQQGLKSADLQEAGEREELAPQLPEQ